jgi:hypothetical protein
MEVSMPELKDSTDEKTDELILQYQAFAYLRCIKVLAQKAKADPTNAGTAALVDAMNAILAIVP